MIFFIYIYIFFITRLSYAKLSKMAQQQIKYIIQHPGTTIEMREKINNVLFHSYKGWATSKAIHFKCCYKQPCYHIKKDEIISYGLHGLYEGIEKYNGNDSFINYIELYMKHRLQLCMRSLMPINALPKTYFKKKMDSKEKGKLYNIYLKPIYIGFDNYLIENTIYNELYYHKNSWIENEDEFLFQTRIWRKIRELPPFQIRLMYYKYSTDFQITKSNRIVADKMGCSEQTIRKNLIDIRKKILPLLDDYRQQQQQQQQQLF